MLYLGGQNLLLVLSGEGLGLGGSKSLIRSGSLQPIGYGDFSRHDTVKRCRLIVCTRQQVRKTWWAPLLFSCHRKVSHHEVILSQTLRACLRHWVTTCLVEALVLKTAVPLSLVGPWIHLTNSWEANVVLTRRGTGQKEVVTHKNTAAFTERLTRVQGCTSWTLS